MGSHQYVTADSEIDSKSTIYNTGDLRIEVEETKNFYMSTKDEGDDVVLLNKGSYTHIGNLYFDSDGRNKLKNDVFENRGSFTLKQGKIQLIGDAAEKGDFDYFVSNYDSFTFEDCSAPTLIYGGGLYSYSGTVKFINTKADMTETLAGFGTLELCNSDITLEGSKFSGGANLSEGSHLTFHSLTGYHVVNTGTEGDINVLELSGFSYIQNTGNGALILNAVADNSGSAIVVLTDVAYFSKVTVNVAGDLRTDYAGNFVTLVQQTRSLESEQKFYINFTNESATFSVGEGKYLSCGQYMTLTPEKFNDYTNILNLSVQNYMLSDRSAVRYASAESELFDRFYALDISNLSKTDFVMYVGDVDAAGETITALGYDQYYSQQAAAITGKIIVENSSVGEIAFSDTALEIKGGSTVGKITGKDDNDKITISDSENYLKQIDLASGINTITVNGAVSELGLEMNSSGKTTVTFTAGSSYENAQISLASSSDVQLKELFLDWNPSSYQEVQILVSSTNDFSNAQYVFVLQNGTEDFTIDLAQNLYYRVDGLTAEGWVSHILNDTVAPDQVWGFHYTETGFVWDAASDNWGGNGVQKYIIEFAADEDFTAILDTVETEQTRYEYTLPEGVTMVYSRVKAVDYDGNAGEWSMISPNIVDETAPAAPGGLTAETDHKNVVFTWDETTDDMTGVKEYTVTYSSANESYSVTLKDTSLALEDLTPGNWTWSVQAVDNAGNISDAAQGEVFVINPFEFAVIGNPLQWVNTDIILTAAAEPGQSLKFAYSFDNTEWIESSVAVISENTTVYFRGENAFGETVTYSITVDRIDKTAPTLEINGNPTEWTNEDVILTATVSDGNVVFYNGTTWIVGAEQSVTANGTYIFRVTDEAGNVTEKSVTVDKIDKVAPVLELSGNPTEWTNKDAAITADAVDAAGNGATVMYKKDSDKEFIQYPGKISENGTYIFYAVDDFGNQSAMQMVVVDKIDKTAPRLMVVGNAEEITNGDVILTAIYEDAESDISKVEYSFDHTEWFSGSEAVVSENGTVYFKVTDIAGNISETSVEVDKIDKTAPTLEISGNPTEWTNEDVVLTATVSDGNVVFYNGTAWVVGAEQTVSANGTYIFRVTDLAGNSAEKSVVVDKIDKTAPSAPVVSADVTELTNSSVTLTADYGDAPIKEYSFDGRSWQSYTSELLLSSNTPVYFRGVDLAGNVSEISFYRVSNIDQSAPALPTDVTVSIKGNNAFVDWNDVADSGPAGVKGYIFRCGTSESLDSEGTLLTESQILFEGLERGIWYYQIASVDNLGNTSEWSAVSSFSIGATAPENLTGTAAGLSWDAVAGVAGYVVEYSTDDFETVISIETDSNAIDALALPESSFKWRVRTLESSEWVCGEEITGFGSAEAELLVSDADNSKDLFFANAAGTWSQGYAAEHQITGELVMLAGKNKIDDIFEGSADVNALVLSDDANGDALFVDDIFTALGDQARFSQIDEIRAGAGDDIVDMTSTRYTYEGASIKIYGGSGNDTIWASSESSILFGDAGNDRLVGASGGDILVGGSGNDSMHGGGGDDIFAFGGDWGNDIVQQFDRGSVTLWFEEGSESNWDADTMTYSDGTNSVTVTGVSEVTLKFGADASLPEGAFSNEASEKIFEDKNKGMIA